MRVSEHLFVLSIEVLVVIVLLPLVERGAISIWVGVGIAVGALIAGVIIERFWKARSRAGLIVRVNTIENEFQSGIYQGDQWYSVQTILRAKFENAQEVQNIITGGEATLWKKRRWMWPKRLAKSFHASVCTSPGGYVDRLPPKKLSLSIAPRTVSDDWRFMFAMTVPRDVNILEDSLFVKVTLDTLGPSNVTVRGPVRPYD
jgi:hypothetical protein